MDLDDYPLLGKVVPQETLANPRAREIASYAASPRSPYVSIVECRRSDGEFGSETVIIDLEIEVAQRPLNPILQRERIGFTVDSADNTYPEISILRDDFPQVPHLNFGSSTGLTTLCLYEETFPELKLHWTARHAIERIRAWLARTANGTLHPHDQPLEPLLGLADGTIIMPFNFSRVSGSDLTPYLVSCKDKHAKRLIFFAQRLEDGPDIKQRPISHVATLVKCPVRTHGVITATPHTLEDLDRFLSVTSFDIINELLGRIENWKKLESFSKLEKCNLFIVLEMPKARIDNAEFETTEFAAFLCGCELAEIDRRLENFRVSQSHRGLIEIPETISEAANIPLLAFDVAQHFSPLLGAICNDCAEEDRQFLLLGAGALGSQLHGNLIRSGFGKWMVVDDDYLMPHNLARHFLGFDSVGKNKAVSLSNAANSLLSENVSKGVNANILQLGDQTQGVLDFLKKSSAILDCSASVPAARHLAHSEFCRPRIISAFLNPTGDSLVCLGEDEKITCRLDWLEMQYYRELAFNPSLRGHLRLSEKMRYSNSCRSVSSTVRQDFLSIFAGIASSVFRSASSNDGAFIRLWTLAETLEVSHLSIQPEPFVEFLIFDWRIYTDWVLLKKVACLRLQQLPNETGGVLIGAYDMTRRIIYVVDALPSPPDSEEWPNTYMRGTVGLSEQVQLINDLTLGNLEYVGEWHSHPQGCSIEQSDQDLRAMEEISLEMSLGGLPGLMLIVGDEGSHRFYIGDPAFYTIDLPNKTP